MVMLRQLVDIDGYWLATVFYLPQDHDIPMVAEALEHIGCPSADVDKLCRLVTEEWNRGGTYSNLYQRKSVTVIGRSTSWSQFFDTVLHETKHLVDDIIAGYDVMNYGEPPAYLQGYIGRQMAPMIRRLACPCCGGAVK